MHDVMLPDHGIGFTDVVKRATARADELDPAEFAAATRELVAKLETFQPRIACFQGMMGYRPFARRHAPALPKPVLGEQPLRIGRTRLFVVPNPESGQCACLARRANRMVRPTGGASRLIGRRRA